MSLTTIAQPPSGPTFYSDVLSDGVERWWVATAPDGRGSFFQSLEELFSVLIGKRVDELPFGRSVAFLVGVSEYRYLEDLPFVRNDLEDMRRALLEQAGFDEIFLAREEVVTEHLIERYMHERFKRELGPRDRLLFYFAGHGADQGGVTGYLQFQGAKSGRFYGDQVMEVRNVEEWSKILPAAHVAFIFDSCSSGLAFAPLRARFGNHEQRVLETLSRQGSRRVITAGTAGERTFEVDSRGRRGNGVFTRAFLDSLAAGTDRGYFMTLEELFAGTIRRVSDFAAIYRQTVTPRMWDLDANVHPGTFVFLNRSIEKPLPLRAEKRFLGIRDRGEGKSDKSVDLAVQIEFWRSALQLDRIDGFRAYLAQWPDGPFATLARARIGELGRAQLATKNTELALPRAGDAWEGPLGMRFRFIPAGRFQMGSPITEPGRDDDEVLHEVELTRPFWIGEAEVTQGQWRELMGTQPSRLKSCGDLCPVERVNWWEALEFTNRLSRSVGLKPCYVLSGCTGELGGGCQGEEELWCSGGYSCKRVTFRGLNCKGFRLPTEAEWEWAARAETTTAFSTGPGLQTEQANYNGNHPYGGAEKGIYRRTTLPVGTLAPNAWNLRDVHGNVWEWVWDRKGEYLTEKIEKDPKGPDVGGARVFRGGSWYSSARDCRSANRRAKPPGPRDASVGMRLARTYRGTPRL